MKYMNVVEQLTRNNCSTVIDEIKNNEEYVDAGEVYGSCTNCISLVEMIKINTKCQFQGIMLDARYDSIRGAYHTTVTAISMT